MRIESDRHYMPVLKWKRGEVLALSELSTDVKDQLSPLLEIPALPYNFETESPAKTIDEHLQSVRRNIEQSIGDGRQAFIDCRFLGRDLRMLNGQPPLAYLLEQHRDLNIHPCVGLTDDYTDADLSAARAHAELAGGEVLIRMSPNIRFRKQIEEISERLNVQRNRCHLMIDCGTIQEDGVEQSVVAAHSSLLSVPAADEWQSIALASASFPQYLARVPPGRSELPRLERALWTQLVDALGDGQRRPIFSDYGVTSRDIEELDPRMISVSANIRYTHRESFHVFKGQSLRRASYEQFRDLSRAVLDSGLYCGEQFSWGDRYIKECASGLASTGNTMTWRKVATNHHLTFVVKQLNGAV
jgi:Beta protein